MAPAPTIGHTDNKPRRRLDAENPGLEWRECLEHTRSTWERCYERQAATPAEAALMRAAETLEREPLPDRACRGCGGAVTGRARAEFGSDQCRKLFHNAHTPRGGEPLQQPLVAVELEEDWSQELVA